MLQFKKTEKHTQKIDSLFVSNCISRWQFSIQFERKGKSISVRVFRARFRRSFSRSYFAEKPKTGKTATIRRPTARETGASWHHGDLIEAPSRPSSQYGTEGFRRGPWLGPLRFFFASLAEAKLDFCGCPNWYKVGN